ncbi:MAG: hypothetical protein ACTSWC_07535, partial [Promethearchaeota archaeon]
NLPDYIETKGKTPLSLRFSLFLLWFGAAGTFLYDFLSLKILWIALTILVSIGFSILLSKVWENIARNTMYRVRLGNELLGRQVTVKIPVSNEGGVISVNTHDSVQMLAARTLNPLGYYYPGDQVYICKVENQVYYVDLDPANIQYNR